MCRVQSTRIWLLPWTDRFHSRTQLGGMSCGGGSRCQSSIRTMRSTQLVFVIALIALGLAMRGSFEAVTSGQHEPHLVIAAIAAAAAAFVIGRRLARGSGSRPPEKHHLP